MFVSRRVMLFLGLIALILLVLSLFSACSEKSNLAAQPQTTAPVAEQPGMVPDMEQTDTEQPDAKQPEQIGTKQIAPDPVDCDYFLEGGTIVDGSGDPPYPGNLAIKGEEIVALGDCRPAPGAKIIAVPGMIVAPGFIDIHTHTENYWAAKGDGLMILNQGITTHITGNCGTSVNDISGFLLLADHKAINVGILSGYKNLRRLFAADNKKVSPDILEKMKKRLNAQMTAGSFGLSLGLSYYPQNQAGFEELVSLAQVVKNKGGFLAVHIRDEYSGVLKAFEEIVNISNKSGVSLQYSHIKAAGPDNWNKMDELLAKLHQAQGSGTDISSDVYGYTWSSWDFGTKQESIAEENVIKALKDPLVMVASDSGLSAGGVAQHPRAYANNIRILAHYVRDQKELSLEEAIRKMTSLPAKRLNLEDRGLLAAGKKADIAVFSLDDLRENATRLDPNQICQGISYVFVNGGLSLDQGKLTGINSGRALRKPKQ
ncbi:MAG: amidohydrolase family protein [Clostridiales bacterium]|nr:amidohydrolase family protein [Clostridiales bacterium]